MKKIQVLIIALIISVGASSQDVRTIETKLADMLARMPVYSSKDMTSLLSQLEAIGEDGWKIICSNIIEPGSGDDTRSRFLIESFSRSVSLGENPELGDRWENNCILFIKSSEDLETKRFFFRQLEIAGTKNASNFCLNYIDNDELIESALAVIELVMDDSAESILADKLKDKNIETAALIMNALAKFHSDIAVGEYIYWSDSKDIGIRAAAFNALAESYSPLALKTLAAAAKAADYSWNPEAAVASYLKYASNMGSVGDIKSMEKICKEVIKKSTIDSGIQYKSLATSVLFDNKGVEALDYLVDNFTDSNKEYRKHVLNLAERIPGEAYTNKYVSLISKLDPEYAADLIWMIGDRGDRTAVAELKKFVSDENKMIRLAAIESITTLEGVGAAEVLISFIHSYPDLDEQEKAFALYSMIADPDRLDIIADAYSVSGEISKAFILTLLAEGANAKYFNLILSETDSDSDLIRNAAFVSLKNVASADNISSLIELMTQTEDKGEILQVQSALAQAANDIQDKEARSIPLLEALKSPELKNKLIPVLSQVGGARSLELVLENFYSGEAVLKELCFDALSAWKDHSASYALFDICNSSEKGYQRAAFEGYIRQISGADIMPEQKLLLLRKIMPLATSADQKVSILSNISDIHTLPALLFAESYFDDNVINQVAISSAIQISLPSGGQKVGLYGDNVKRILEKITGLIKGQGSEYEIERIRAYISDMPVDKGFVSMFSGTDLRGWQGLVENPIARSKMSESELAKKQLLADSKMADNWSVKDGAIWFNGQGANLCSIKDYADFEMLVDWRITKKGDSGLYLRGSPQVQIWDTSRVEVGAQVGSGGLYNNAVNMSHPLKVADNPIGDWNTFRILMIGERVSVWLNGEIVVDDVIMENYWDRSIPIFPSGAIELQAHGNELAFRDIYVREIDAREYNLTAEEKADGFEALFNGSNLEAWIGADNGSYIVEDGTITINPGEASGGNLYTEKEYSDFNFRFEFKLTADANNGLGIRAPLTGDAAYLGMELQILDNGAEVYANLEPYQYHGSVYGVIPAKRGFLKPLGEWNSEEVIVDGTHIKIILNGEVIVDGDIADARENGTMDHRDHPGLKRDSGHIGFLGHGFVLWFRNIRIKDLNNK